jgi:hypothetical protein
VANRSSYFDRISLDLGLQLLYSFSAKSSDVISVMMHAIYSRNFGLKESLVWSLPPCKKINDCFASRLHVVISTAPLTVSFGKFRLVCKSYLSMLCKASFSLSNSKRSKNPSLPFVFAINLTSEAAANQFPCQNQEFFVWRYSLSQRRHY